MMQASPYLQIIQTAHLQPFMNTVGGIFAALHEEKDCKLPEDDWHMIMFNKLFTWWFKKKPVPPNLTKYVNPYKMTTVKYFRFEHGKEVELKKSDAMDEKHVHIKRYANDELIEQDNQIKKSCSDLLMELHIIEKSGRSIELSKDENIFIKTKKITIDKDTGFNVDDEYVLSNYTLGCGFINTYKYLKKIGIPLDHLDVNLSGACETTNQEIIDLLFNEIEEQKANPEELLSYVCKCNIGLFMLKAFLSKFNLELSDENKLSLLGNTHIDVLEWLIFDQNVDPLIDDNILARNIFTGNEMQLVKWYEEKIGFDEINYFTEDFAILYSCGCNYDIFKYLIDNYGLFGERFQKACIVRILSMSYCREIEKFLSHFNCLSKFEALCDIISEETEEHEIEERNLPYLINDIEFKKYILTHYKKIIKVTEEFKEFWNSILQSIESNTFIRKQFKHS